MSLRVKIALNTLVQILGKIISAGCTFLITILIARRFGVLGFGEFVKITTYVSLFYLISDFGLNAIVLRELENKKLKIKNEQQGLKIFFSNLLGLRVIFALVLIFLSLTILVFLPFNPLTLEGFTPLSKLGIIILAPTILTQAIFTSANAIFQKNLRYDLSVLASSIGSFLSLALVFLLLRFNSSLLLVISSYLVTGLVMAETALHLSQLKISNCQLSTSLWRRLFFKSLPLGLTLIFNLIYFKADTLILSVFRPTKEVGIYGLARSFFEFPLAIPTFFMNSVYPVLLKLKIKNERLKIIRKSMLFLFLSSLFTCLICYLLATYIPLIKPDFAPSILVFRILSLYLPVFFLSSLFMWTLIAFGKQRLLFFIYGSIMLVNIFLNLIFIPRFGYLAAVVILGASELVVLGLMANSVLKKEIIE